MFSGLPPTADISERDWHVSVGPTADMQCRQAMGPVPPSMTYSVPVIAPARGETRNATRSATSLGLAAEGAAARDVQRAPRDGDDQGGLPRALQDEALPYACVGLLRMAGHA